MKTKLTFYWSDIKPSEENNMRQAQLALAVGRIAFVREELESALNANEIEDMLERLQYHAENYLVRAYELRERAERLVKRLQRSASTKVTATSPNLTEPLKRLQNIVESDLDLRDFHTHDRSLSFGFWTGHAAFDWRDFLLQFEDSPGRRAEDESVLREEAKLFVAEYSQKCTDVIEATMSLLMATNKVRSDSNPSVPGMSELLKPDE